MIYNIIYSSLLVNPCIIPSSVYSHSTRLIFNHILFLVFISFYLIMLHDDVVMKLIKKR